MMSKINPFILVLSKIDPLIVVLSIVIATLAVALPLCLTVTNRSQWKDLVGLEPTWKFSDWAGAMTPIGTVLGLVLPIIQSNPAITGLSLIFGAATLLLPFAYSTVWTDRRGPVWFFLLWSSLMQLAVLAQLLTAAALADDGILITLPTLTLNIFRGCLIGGAFLALLYTWRSTRYIIQYQTKKEVQKQANSQDQLAHTTESSGSPMDRLPVASMLPQLSYHGID